MPKESYHQRHLPDINPPFRPRIEHTFFGEQFPAAEGLIFYPESKMLTPIGSEIQRIQFLTHESMQVHGQTESKKDEERNELENSTQKLGYEPTRTSLEPLMDQYHQAVRSRTEKFTHGYYSFDSQKPDELTQPHKQLALPEVQGKVIEFRIRDKQPQALSVVAGD